SNNSAEKSGVIASAPAELGKTNCVIKFESEGISVTGDGAKPAGNIVSITKSGVYELSGNTSDCKIEINADKKAEITLLLNNVSLTSRSGSVIDCESAKTLTLYTKNGTKNSLSDTGNYTGAEDEADAAVFTRSDLLINGEGELTITGRYGDAVKCKDAVVIYNGALNIVSADDGITGKDSVTVYGGTLSVNAGGDGIKSTNSTDAGRGNITIAGGELDITSEKDGIQAEKVLTINGGKIAIKSGGDAADADVTAQDSPWDFDRRGGFRDNQGAQVSQSAQSSQSGDASSHKGLKAGGGITITSGDINIKAADDSIHSNADVEINGGTLTLSSCDDGVHADETLRITDGEVTITKSYEGLEGKCIEIDGGVISVKAADDGLNAAGGDNGSYFGFGQASADYYISITGGTITVDADGDGVDSNGTIAQSGGTVTVFGPTSSANGALDYEMSYAMSGGTLMAFGAQGMAQTPSTLSQPCLSISAQVSAGSTVEVREGSKVILSATLTKAAQSLIFSCEEFEAGTDYDVYVDGSVITTITAADGVSGNGGIGGNGGFGGGHGGFNPGQGGFNPGQGGRPNSGRFPAVTM
ncbi:MAG: carbohydrate-binding domain-containing protein, partial [Oscillospiraceae bacterium]|nr:carbohydrate-binding domain-containing protein [Oscillospiraceae bacterium]